MRRATHGSYPVVVIWENVPGAFSSNGGEDFRAVLEELARVEEPDASIPRPPGADGAKPEQSPEMDGPWLGDSLTLNIGECPREESVSLLSWILQDDVPEKYYLSTKLPGHPDQSIQTWQEVARTAGNRPAGNDRMVGQQGGKPTP